MRIRCLWVGKTREAFLRQGIEKYRALIAPRVPLELVTVAGEPALPKAEIRRILDREAKRVLSRLKPGEYVILLDEAGTSYTSVTFARMLEHLLFQDGRNVVFGVAGPLGAGTALRERADARLSLSPMTLTHEMIRVVLLEQIYRALNIIQGRPYHY